jgi:hypothetical protein
MLKNSNLAVPIYIAPEKVLFSKGLEMFYRLFACLTFISSLMAPHEMKARDKSPNSGASTFNAGGKVSNTGGNSSNAESASSSAGIKSSNRRNSTKSSKTKQDASRALKALHAAKGKYASASVDLDTSISVWKDSKEQYDSYVSLYTGRTPGNIQSDLDSLDPGSETYQSDLASLMTEKEAYNLFVDKANALAKLVNDNFDVFEVKQKSLHSAEQVYKKALETEQSFN